MNLFLQYGGQTLLSTSAFEYSEGFNFDLLFSLDICKMANLGCCVHIVGPLFQLGSTPAMWLGLQAHLLNARGPTPGSSTS